MEEDRFSYDGQPVILEPRQAVMLALALHELCTNAIKHGALLNPSGSVALQWSVSPLPERRLALVWQERGGPPVILPQRHGFGLKMIQQGLAHELDGEVSMAFERDGLRCTIEVPLPDRDSRAGPASPALDQ